MHVTVRGKQLDVGDALRGHVNTTLTGLVGKYFSNPIEANVVLSRDAHLFKADIQVHVGRNIVLQSNSEATEPYPAFDEAAEKIAKRLRRYKRRLRDHSHKTIGDTPDGALEATKARKYILDAGLDSAADHEEAAEPADGGHQSMVVAEMETAIELLTVSEAVMRMDLADLPALMFRNRAHGGLNMIYRRPDGHVGWVDPAEAAQKGNGKAAATAGAHA
ncbi:MAG TPA: ribosome-associated translation inhibitor RaiA [Azospirillaceae bacterium]|nr:ribosome-associated translation inhibitor RaiA [Azospirillaceae bacterium]